MNPSDKPACPKCGETHSVCTYCSAEEGDFHRAECEEYFGIVSAATAKPPQEPAGVREFVRIEAGHIRIPVTRLDELNAEIDRLKAEVASWKESDEVRRSALKLAIEAGEKLIAEKNELKAQLKVQFTLTHRYATALERIAVQSEYTQYEMSVIAKEALEGGE